MFKQVIQAVSRALTYILVGLIQLYQYCISPLLGARCRFIPGCSSYAIEAIQQHGPFRGGYLTAKRLLKCQPFHAGGLDPVPKIKR